MAGTFMFLPILAPLTLNVRSPPPACGDSEIHPTINGVA